MKFISDSIGYGADTNDGSADKWKDGQTLKISECNIIPLTTFCGGAFFFLFILIWVLWPFQEYFTYIEPIVNQWWAKTGELGVRRTWLSHI